MRVGGCIEGNGRHSAPERIEPDRQSRSPRIVRIAQVIEGLRPVLRTDRDVLEPEPLQVPVVVLEAREIGFGGSGISMIVRWT